MTFPRGLAAVLVAAAVVCAEGPGAPAAVAPAAARTDSRSRAPARLPRVGNLFVENRGQVGGPVAYYVKGRGTDVFLTPHGVTFALTGHGARCAVKIDFVGADPEVRPHGRAESPTVVSYFKGPRAQWKTGLRTFREVVYTDVWPGIDAVYRADADRVKTTFVVRPGADPARIRVRYRGAASVSVAADGHLDVATAAGGFRDEAPLAWQESDSGRDEVTVAYALGDAEAGGARVCGFAVGGYDASRALEIDPAVLVYSGFLGGDLADECRGIAVDGQGNVYLTGRTYSSETTFPVLAGPDSSYAAGATPVTDAFVAKVSAGGATLVYAGYIGGDDLDVGLAIAVDASGGAYVAGYTYSDGTTFPVAVGPRTTFNGGAWDGFIVKVNPAGTSLAYAGYIGGAGVESCNAVAVDGSGNAYLTGFTNSDQSTFPVLVGPDLTINGSLDAFVAKVNPAGTALLYAGFIGGDDREIGKSIAVDSSGNAYVGGDADSDAVTFPVLVGPDLSRGGNTDGFVAKVNAAGTALVYCGYVGGDGTDDEVYGIAVDSTGSAYVTGRTDSNEESFPVRVGPGLTLLGESDAFVVKVDPTGAGFTYAGYIGDGEGQAIAVDAAGAAYVAGSTRASPPQFPAANGPGATPSGDRDAFVAKVVPSGAALEYAGYVGGTLADEALAIAIDAAGDAYVAGFTYSDEASFPVVGGPDPTYNGTNTNGFESYGDAFVAKVHFDPVVVIDSFFLPKKVTARLNATTPAKSFLAANGIFDTGSKEVDLTAPATLTVGGLRFDIPGLTVSPDGTTFTYRSGATRFLIKPNPNGSSRAKFRLKAVADLAGKIDPNGPLDVQFTSQAADGRCRVALSRGGFGLGKVRGALLEPNLNVQRAAAVLGKSSGDEISIVVGLATNGATPASASDFSVTFGALTTTITAAGFTQSGDRYVFKGNVDGVTSVVLDYEKEQIFIKGRGLDLGDIPEGPSAQEIQVGLGADLRAVRVRVARNGSTLKY